MTARMNRVLVVTMVMLGGLPSAPGVSLAAAPRWERKADAPVFVGTAGASASSVNGKIYFIGGGQSRTLPSEQVARYDPGTGTWVSRAEMPTARQFLGTAVLDGKIYAIGGFSGLGPALSTVEEYDPSTDTWTRKADMPRGRGMLGTVALEGRIYAIGGTSSLAGAAGWSLGQCCSSVYAYTPSTDTWEIRADMPTGRAGLGVVAANAKIYAIGGLVQIYTVAEVLLAVEEYDPITDTWSVKANLPDQRAGSCTIALDERIHVLGGIRLPSTSAFGEPCSTVYEYEPLLDTWITRPETPSAKTEAAAAVVGRECYLVGGSEVAFPYSPYFPTVWELSGPSPDLDGSGIVDIEDLLRLIESWGQEDASADLAPGFFGDGIVDAKDLEAVMGYWGRDLRLVAHWTLDEAVGTTACDMVSGESAAVMGDAEWQPVSGAIGGALAFDGANDFVVTQLVLDPAHGPFSAYLWVKGGAPGQVIISQAEGADWLATDASGGTLMTGLARPPGGRTAPSPLVSECVITDGAWHCVGLVWDGMNRVLYVDDVLVAEDAQPSLAGSTGRLNIGCGKDQTPGTFWSGLMDDIRIYNQAVNP